MDKEDQGPVKVTVTDAKTGALIEEKVVADDYMLITQGRRYLKSMQVMGQTHMLAVAVNRNGYK